MDFKQVAGLTLVEALVALAILSILACMLIPIMMRGRVDAYKVQCVGNLKEIAKMAIIYADSTKTGLFPHGGKQDSAAHESLNVMVMFFGDIKPQMFTCPEWTGGVAEMDENGKYLLSADTCAYTWSKTQLSERGPSQILSSDKFIRTAKQPSGHLRGMNVVYTDTAVNFVLAKDIDGKDGLMQGLVR